MKELKCPNCGSVFSVDEEDYASIVSQVKTKEFQEEMERRVKELGNQHRADQETVMAKAERKFQQQMSDKELELEKKEGEIVRLNEKINGIAHAKQLEFNEILAQKENKTVAQLRDKVFGSRLTGIYAGGAHLPEELVHKYKEAKILICQGYGMTECSPTISTPDPSRPDKAYTAGRIAKRCQTRIVNGELQVKSPSVMMGYCNDPEKTAEVITEDGWLRTGDLGYVDSENFLHITGRIKNLIILGNGENVSPEQLETFNRFPEANRAKVLEQLRKQLGVEAPPMEIKAPVLDDNDYTPPVKETAKEPVQPAEELKAPVLDDAPEPPAYKPKYVDEDLERAKREARTKAVAGELASGRSNSKENLKNMLELKEQLRREQAQKGFKLCFLISALGIIAGVVFYLLYSGSLGLTYKDGLDGFAAKLKDGSLYIAAGMIVSGLTLATGVGFLKSLTSVIYLVSGILQIFPGVVMIPQHNGSLALIITLYVLSLGFTIAAFFMMTGSESVGAYFSKGTGKASEYSTTNSNNMNRNNYT